MGYRDVYSAAQADPEAFWMEAAQAIDWITPPTRALNSDNAPLYEWFTDAEVNTCWNAVDRHVEAGNGDRAAIIYDSPITGSKSTTSYAELQNQTAALAGALAEKGITKGDRVIIYMSMVPEALVAMLACARIGAIHSVVFGGFAASELAVRIEDAQPKAMIATSCGVEPGRVVEYKPLLDAAIVQDDVRVLVRPVVMNREDIVPLVAVFAALEEMLRPVHRDVAHLVDRHVGREREQHVRGEPELGRAAPGPGPVLDDVLFLLLRKHRRIGQRVGQRRIGVDRLVVDIGELCPKRSTRFATSRPDPFEHRRAALPRRRLQRVTR